MSRTSFIVMIVIVATLVCLIVPAISNVRQAAALTQCDNNMRQLGVAIHNYHDAYKKYPGPVISRSKLPIEQRMSWMMEIMPYIESNDIYVRANLDQPWNAIDNRYSTGTHPIYRCPAQGGDAREPWASYVGMAGVGKNAIELLQDDPKSGFFGYKRTIAKDDIQDGLSNTICIAETNRDNGPWAKSGYTTVRGVDPEGTDYLGQHGQFGSSHYKSTGFLSGGYLTMIGLADASVRTLTDSVDPRVVEALATIAGGEKLPEDF